MDYDRWKLYDGLTAKEKGLKTYIFELVMHKEVEIEARSEQEALDIISDNLSDSFTEDDIEIQ